jgi:hypothetical protein
MKERIFKEKYAIEENSLKTFRYSVNAKRAGIWVILNPFKYKRMK